jgi:predicted negative regulator of RcsB-dependent stress response
MKNFIEIGKTDDEQEQQIKKWIKENALQIIIGITLGLSGIWGLNAYDVYQHQQSIQARILYLNATTGKNEIAFKKLNKDYASSGYAQEAVLMQAKVAAKSGHYAQALSHLQTLTNAENGLIATVATMRMARVQLEMGDFQAAINTLNNKKFDEFDGLYNQLKGDIYTADNQIDKAKEHYQLALNQLSAESELQNLIRIKLSDLD